MKKYGEKTSAKRAAVLVTIVLCAFLALTGCGKVYVERIVQTANDGGVITYTVYYSDGSTSTFEIVNGVDGDDGKDGKDVSIDDVYRKYVEIYGDISYAEFLEKYLNLEIDSLDGKNIASCLQSSMKVHAEFVESVSIGGIRPGQSSNLSDIVMSSGSAVIWSMVGDDTYIVTNYHVVYDDNADTSKNGGSKLARRINAYLYGSESAPSFSGKSDSNGYSVIDYGDYVIPCEYVGGSAVCDLAVLKASTAKLKAINPDCKPVTLASGYYVGETAIAIGNTENNGISVTRGIVSVDNEFINLSVDGTVRAYRSIRIDTAIYSGNSGGGLFDSEGRLIGITNAGDDEDQNINFAIPIEIVKNAVENILYYSDGSFGNNKCAYKIKLGIGVEMKNTRYVFDPSLGRGKIVEDVYVESVTSGSPASFMGLKAGDLIKSITVGSKEYTLNRYFEISDILFTVRRNDVLKIKYERGGTEATSAPYTVIRDDLYALD